MPRFARNQIQRVWSSHAQVAHTGTTSETTLVTISVPPMGPNDHLQIECMWSMTNNANSKTMRVRFGGTSFVSLAVTTNATYRFAYTIANRNSTSSQIGGASPAYAGSAAANITGTIDTTSARDLVFAGLLANSADSIALEGYRVELIRA